MGSKMDMTDLELVNRLWEKIYPYLADQILDYYARVEGDVLEWGAFSGGIAFSLLAKRSALKIKIAVMEDEVFDLMAKEVAARELTGRIVLEKSGLYPLDYEDGRFDLVIIRGAYFFLDSEGTALREIYRVMKKGGIGFVGGGYGKNAPPEVIDAIAEESRILNDRLGRIRVTVADLESMIGNSGLGGHIRIVEEGGLWLLLEK